MLNAHQKKINGRLEDFIEAAKYFKTRKVNEKVRCLIVPGSRRIKNYLDRSVFQKS